MYSALASTAIQSHPADWRDLRCEVLREQTRISALRPAIVSFERSLGLAKSDGGCCLDYCLAFSLAARRSPVVVLLWRGTELSGVAVGSQGMFFGFPFGVVYLGTGDDERFLLARESESGIVLEAAVRALLRHRLIHTVTVLSGPSLGLPPSSLTDNVEDCTCDVGSAVARSTLELGDSYEEFLMSLSKTTRRTVRRYRRYAVEQGWTFQPVLSPSELIPTLRSMVPHQRTSRHTLNVLVDISKVLPSLGTPIMAGMFDGKNQPVSVLMGWRAGNHGFLLVQLNHRGPAYDRANVSTVARSSLIEELSNHGVQRLTMVGSCMGRFEPSCVPMTCRNLVLKKLGVLSTMYWQSHKLRFPHTGFGRR